MLAIAVDLATRAFELYTHRPQRVRQIAYFAQRFRRNGMAPKVLRAVQNRRMRRTISYAYQRSPYYRSHFSQTGLHPRDIRTIADLRHLPFTTAADIRNWQQFLCVSEDDVSAVFTTSGTTGEPKRVYFTSRELNAMTNFAAFALRFGQPGRLVALLALPMSHGFWIGSATAHRVVERAGGLPLPVGADDPVEAVAWMRRFSPNVVISSCSYLAAITRQAEREGYRPRLERVLLGGETVTPDRRSLFQEYWNTEVLDSYGSTEIGGGQTLALPECTAFNLNDMHLVTEIINPDTGQSADEGELVFTTLLREAMPLLRYRSGDRGRWSNCPCGLPFQAIQLTGRTDDMFVAGDMNLYANVVAAAVERVTGATGRITIELDRVEAADRVVLRVEGEDVNEDAVRGALFVAYPEFSTNISNGNILLDVQIDVSLGPQIKAFKIVDRRSGFGDHRQVIPMEGA
jgi:phenylacetate-CoA ligase